MFWVEKYTPISFNSSSFLFNKNIVPILKNISKGELNHPHICFYGIRGSGKYTLARCFLREIFGSTVYDIRKKNITLSKKQIVCMASSYHFEFYGNQYTKYSSEEFTEILDSIANHMCIDNYNTMNPEDNRPMYVLIRNINMWDPYIYSLIKHISEKYNETLRFIVTSSTFGRELPNFSMIRIPQPSKKEIINWIHGIFENEEIEITLKIKNAIKDYIRRNNNYHLSEYVTAFERHHATLFMDINKPNVYEKNCKLILQMIKTKRIESYLKIRPLLVECVLKETQLEFIKYMLYSLVQQSWITDEQKINITHYAGIISHRLAFKGITKTVVHSEAFIMKVFTILR